MGDMPSEMEIRKDRDRKRALLNQQQFQTISNFYDSQKANEKQIKQQFNANIEAFMSSDYNPEPERQKQKSPRYV